MQNVFFELWKDNSQVPEEGLSDSNGTFCFSVKQVGTLHIVANQAGFITTTKQINVTSGFLMAIDQRGTYLVTIPMVRDYNSEDDKAFAILSFNGNLANVRLIA